MWIKSGVSDLFDHLNIEEEKKHFIVLHVRKQSLHSKFRWILQSKQLSTRTADSNNTQCHFHFQRLIRLVYLYNATCQLTYDALKEIHGIASEVNIVLCHHNVQKVEIPMGSEMQQQHICTAHHF